MSTYLYSQLAIKLAEELKDVANSTSTFSFTNATSVNTFIVTARNELLTANAITNAQAAIIDTSAGSEIAAISTTINSATSTSFASPSFEISSVQASISTVPSILNAHIGTLINGVSATVLNVNVPNIEINFNFNASGVTASGTINSFAAINVDGSTAIDTSLTASTFINTVSTSNTSTVFLNGVIAPVHLSTVTNFPLVQTVSDQGVIVGSKDTIFFDGITFNALVNNVKTDVQKTLTDFELNIFIAANPTTESANSFISIENITLESSIGITVLNIDGNAFFPSSIASISNVGKLIVDVTENLINNQQFNLSVNNIKPDISIPLITNNNFAIVSAGTPRKDIFITSESSFSTINLLPTTQTVSANIAITSLGLSTNTGILSPDLSIPINFILAEHTIGPLVTSIDGNFFVGAPSFVNKTTLENAIPSANAVFEISNSFVATTVIDTGINTVITNKGVVVGPPNTTLLFDGFSTTAILGNAVYFVIKDAGSFLTIVNNNEIIASADADILLSSIEEIKINTNVLTISHDASLTIQTVSALTSTQNVVVSIEDIIQETTSATLTINGNVTSNADSEVLLDSIFSFLSVGLLSNKIQFDATLYGTAIFGNASFRYNRTGDTVLLPTFPKDLLNFNPPTFEVSNVPSGTQAIVSTVPDKISPNISIDPDVPILNVNTGIIIPTIEPSVSGVQVTGTISSLGIEREANKTIDQTVSSLVSIGNSDLTLTANITIEESFLSTISLGTTGLTDTEFVNVTDSFALSISVGTINQNGTATIELNTNAIVSSVNTVSLACSTTIQSVSAFVVAVPFADVFESIPATVNISISTLGTFSVNSVTENIQFVLEKATQLNLFAGDTEEKGTANTTISSVNANVNAGIADTTFILVLQTVIAQIILNSAGLQSQGIIFDFEAIKDLYDKKRTVNVNKKNSSFDRVKRVQSQVRKTLIHNKISNLNRTVYVEKQIRIVSVDLPKSLNRTIFAA